MTDNFLFPNRFVLTVYHASVFKDRLLGFSTGLKEWFQQSSFCEPMRFTKKFSVKLLFNNFFKHASALCRVSLSYFNFVRILLFFYVLTFFYGKRVLQLLQCFDRIVF